MAVDVQLDFAAIAAFVAEDAGVAAAGLAIGEKAVEYWKTEAPTGDKEHRLADGVIDKPGDYKDSIKATPMVVNGEQGVRVEAHDYKAEWIEYGSKKMPPSAPCAKTRAYLLSLGCSPGAEGS
jgi:hypothetical protein